MGRWTEIYTRCMDGEFFRGVSCPRDGFSSETSTEISHLGAAMRSEGLEPTLDLLVERGFAGNIEEVIIVEFASPELAPEWFTPNGRPSSF